MSGRQSKRFVFKKGMGKIVTKKERKWKWIYLLIMLFTYLIYIPAFLLDWLVLDGKFPLIPLFIGAAIPFMRRNHLKKIRFED
ncbi:hypothetical protein B14911_20230 [Bacillus sp. NRRL B-14911]|nr:hypothetical protein B14911_20230 [Bacillus sp. NRRL B-14911]